MWVYLEVGDMRLRANCPNCHCPTSPGVLCQKSILENTDWSSCCNWMLYNMQSTELYNMLCAVSPKTNGELVILRDATAEKKVFAVLCMTSK